MISSFGAGVCTVLTSTTKSRQGHPRSRRRKGRHSIKELHAHRHPAAYCTSEAMIDSRVNEGAVSKCSHVAVAEHQKACRVRRSAVRIEPATEVSLQHEVWDVPTYYAIADELGRGAYGSVRQAVDKRSGKVVAIKRVAGVFNDPVDCLRAMREIIISSNVSHHNIMKLLDVCVPSSPSNFKDMYLVFDIADSDLRQLLLTSSILSELHVKVLMYKILKGIQYLHSKGVCHRDIKPENILINRDCSVLLCDFGLARYSNKDCERSSNSAEGAIRRRVTSEVLVTSESSLSPYLGLPYLSADFTVSTTPPPNYSKHHSGCDVSQGSPDSACMQYFDTPEAKNGDRRSSCSTAASSNDDSPTVPRCDSRLRKAISCLEPTMPSLPSLTEALRSCSEEITSTLRSRSLSVGHPDTSERYFTRHVTTRQYRAPEIILGQSYDEKADIWSAGCIFAELLQLTAVEVGHRRPLFLGTSCYPLSPVDSHGCRAGRASGPACHKLYHQRLHTDQLSLILSVLGAPTTVTASVISSAVPGGLEEAKKYLAHFKSRQPTSLKEHFPYCSDEAVNLLSRMLTFDQFERASATEILQSEFFDVVRDCQGDRNDNNQVGEVDQCSSHTLPAWLSEAVFTKTFCPALARPLCCREIERVRGRLSLSVADKLQHALWHISA